MVFNLIGFRIFHTYAGVVRYSSFVDLRRIAYAMAVSCVIAEVMHYPLYFLFLNIRDSMHKIVFYPLAGRYILLMYIIALIMMWTWRVLVKTIFDVSYKKDKAMRTLVYGVR